MDKNTKEEKRDVVLLDGTPGFIREIHPGDREALREAFRELSEESRFRRFFFQKSSLTAHELEHLANPDGRTYLAYGLGVSNEETGEEEPIAVCHCFRIEGEPNLGELALVTADLWQGNGAGNELLKTLSSECLRVGITKWYANLLEDNQAMLRLLARFGTLETSRAAGPGIREIICRLAVPGE